MSGPPTPPPSSALEIEDAARTTVVLAQPTTAPPDTPQGPTEQPAAIVPSVSVPPTNPYRQAFTAIVDLASHARYEELTQTAEFADLNVDGDSRPERLLVTAPLVLSYLILDDIPPAIHALQRLPRQFVAGAALPRALLNLVVAVSGRRYQDVYALAARAQDSSHNAGTPEGLQPALTLLLEKFIEGFRRKTFELLSRVYTSVSLSLVQSYLGVPAEQVLEIAAQYKWSFDALTQTFSPRPSPLGSKGIIDVNLGHSTLANFNAIADLKLE